MRTLLLYVPTGLLTLYAMLVASTGELGITDVKATQVCVRMDHLRRTVEVVDRPGYQLFLPLFQEIHLLDKRPIAFTMTGDMRRGANEVPFLTVRSQDGSNFWFESVEIQYRMLPEQAELVLRDSGTGEAYKRKWMQSMARSVLRDEFGRYRAEQIADPTTYEEARERSVQRLNQLLDGHGLQVVQLVTPKPRFETEYEQAIDQRKVAEQEVERLAQEEQQLEHEREQALAAVRKQMDIDREKALGQMRVKLLEARNEDISERADAEAYAESRRSEALAMREERRAHAETTRVIQENASAALAARVAALDEGGDAYVRETLVEALGGVEFVLAPYRLEPGGEGGAQ